MMIDKSQTKRQITSELVELRQVYAELEALEAERKYATIIETALESAENFMALAENAQDAIMIAAGEEILVYANRRAAEITGYSISELLESTIKDILHPDEVEKVTQRHRDRLAGKPVPPQYETILLRKDKVSVPVELTDAKTLWRGQPADMVIIRDIAERKQAEEELKRQEARFRALIENSLDAIAILDSEGNIRYESPSVELLLGYKPEELIGKSALEFFHPDEVENAIYILDTLIKNPRQPVSLVLHLRHKDGSWRVMECTVNNLLNDPNVNGIVANYRDITERKRAEEQLKESEERLRLMFESVTDGIVVADLKGVITEVNRGVLEMSGFSSRDELVGKSAFEFLAPGDYKKIETDMLKALGQGIIKNIEYALRKKDGSAYLVEVGGGVLKDAYGNPIGFIGTMRDITERMQAEERLRRSEEYFRALTENSLDIIFVVDKIGTMLYVSPSIERFSGYKPEELIGRSAFEFIQPDDLSRAIHDFNEAIQTKDIAIYDMFRVRHKDGSERVLEGLGTNFLDNPVIGGFVMNVRDVTERMQAEEELRKYREHLEELVEERTAELTAVNKELEAFAYSISHDLRAPLRSINGFSHALLEDCQDRLDEQGKDYLQRVCSAVQRMGELIDDLLALSQLSRSEMRREIVNLTALARAIADELQKREPERQVEFVIAPELVTNGDASLIQVLLENLLDNAWKFTSKHPRARIEFGALPEMGGKTVYFVRDDGVGFDMAYANKLFQPFQRLHTSTDYSGTGIGLATVQRIVNRHGGRVWAEAAVERGATFYFTL